MSTYIGNGKKHPKFDAIIFGFTAEHLDTLRENLNDRGWVNVIISAKKDDREKFTCKIDDFKPRSGKSGEMPF